MCSFYNKIKHVTFKMAITNVGQRKKIELSTGPSGTFSPLIKQVRGELCRIYTVICDTHTAYSRVSNVESLLCVVIKVNFLDCLFFPAPSMRQKGWLYIASKTDFLPFLGYWLALSPLSRKVSYRYNGCLQCTLNCYYCCRLVAISRRISSLDISVF